MIPIVVPQNDPQVWTKVGNNHKMENNNNYGSPYAPSSYNPSFQPQPYGMGTGMDVPSSSYSTPSSQPVAPIQAAPVAAPV